MIQGESWQSPRQRQYPDRKLTDLTKVKPFGTICWTHAKKARRKGKSDSVSGGEQGVLFGYDDDQGPLLARVFFSDTKIFELHDNGYIQYQSFKDQITGVVEPEKEPWEKLLFFTKTQALSYQKDRKTSANTHVVL